MSEDEQKPTDEAEQATAETATEADAGGEGGPVVPSLLGHDATPMRSLLSRPSDVAARPGFRAPSNKKTKAQKSAKKKARKKRKR
jgi:hypothetical protein